MWTPVNINAVPSEQELIYAKSAIEQLEIELKDACYSLSQAQLRVNRIRQNLWERRAWIAPIRRLCVDVLRLIFEFCGEDGWETPLCISHVSRHWRDVVLAMPRAWAFLDLHKCLEYGGKEMIDHFFKHSGQQPLHIYLDKSQDLPMISSVVERLECLSIREASRMTEYPAFPRLKRLSLGDRTGYMDISNLQITRLPALRELVGEPAIGGDVVSTPRSIEPTYPPLQVLAITISSGNAAWLDLLIGCQSSLVSLRLTAYQSFPAPRGVDLPMLRCLEIILWTEDPDGWQVDLKTPLLETYIECRICECLPMIPVHPDIGNVRQMRLNVALCVSDAPLLRSLQLGRTADINYVLWRLRSNRDYCPNLELIEVHDLEHSDFYNDKLEMANRERSQPISLTDAKIWPRDLPFAIVRSPCGPNIPCRTVY